MIPEELVDDPGSGSIPDPGLQPSQDDPITDVEESNDPPTDVLYRSVSFEVTLPEGWPAGDPFSILIYTSIGELVQEVMLADTSVKLPAGDYTYITSSTALDPIEGTFSVAADQQMVIALSPQSSVAMRPMADEEDAGGTVSIALQSQDATVANELPAGTRWQIYNFTTGAVVQEGELNAAAVMDDLVIAVPGVLFDGDYYVYVENAWPNFYGSYAEFTIAGATPVTATVTMPLAVGKLKLNLSATHPEVAQIIPAGSTWTLYEKDWISIDYVASGEFSETSLPAEITLDILLRNGASYFLSIDTDSTFGNMTDLLFNFQVSDPTLDIALSPMGGRAKLQFSSASPDITSTCIIGTGWTLYGSNGSQKNGYNPGCPDGFPASVLTGPLGYGNYTLVVSMVFPYATNTSVSFTIDSAETQDIPVVLELAAGKATFDVRSEYPNLVNALPSGSSWTLMKEGTGAYATGTFTEDQLDLADGMAFSQVVPPGEYWIEIAAQPDFLTYTSAHFTVEVGEISDVDLVLTPVTETVTVNITSSTSELQPIMPAGSSWSIKNTVGDVVAGDTFTGDDLKLNTQLANVGPLAHDTYTLTVDASPRFQIFETVFTVSGASQLVDVDLVPELATVTMQVQLADPDAANDFIRLHPSAWWEISYDGVQVWSGSFYEAGYELPTSVTIPKAVHRGDLTVTIHAEPGFALYTQTFEINSAEQTIDVNLTPVVSEVTVHLSSSHPDLVTELPVDAQITVRLIGVGGPEQTFNVGGQALPGDVLTLQLPYGSYVVQVLENSAFWLNFGSLDVIEPAQTVNLELPAKVGKVAISLESAVDLGVPLYLPGDATWEIQRNGVTIRSGVFAPDVLGNLVPLPAVIPFTDQLPFGEYNLVITADPTFAPLSFPFWVESYDTSVFEVELTPTVGIVDITVDSSDAAIADELPVGSIWTLTRSDNGSEVIETGTFDDDHRQLPQTVTFSEPLLFGTYEFTIDAGSSFENKATTFTVETATVEILGIELTPKQMSSPAVVTLLNTSGPSGSLNIVSVSGFTPREQLSIRLVGSGTSVTLQTTSSGRTGATAVIISIPASTQPGAYQIVVTGANSGISGSAAYTVQGPVVLLAPAQGRPGSLAVVLASGYAPNERVTVRLVGPGTNKVLQTVNSGSSGMILSLVMIPFNAQPGDYQIVVTGNSSGRIGNANFLIKSRFGYAHPAGSYLVERHEFVMSREVA